MAESKKEKVDKLQLEVTQIARTKSILNSNQIQKIFNSTPRKFIYNRPAKGGGSWNYVRASYVRKALDGVFGFDWDFTIETPIDVAFTIAQATGVCTVHGRLRCRVEVDGKMREITKDQYGRCEIKFKKNSNKVPLDFGNDMKAAASDALKKCASLIGIAADIYDPDEFQEIEVIGSDENSERTKAAQKQIKNADKLLKAESKKVKK